MITLEEILSHYGMPKENIEVAVTQIAQGYGACRYLEGVSDGADAVKEMGKGDPYGIDKKPKQNIDLSDKTPEQAEAFISSLGALAYDTGRLMREYKQNGKIQL